MNMTSKEVRWTKLLPAFVDSATDVFRTMVFMPVIHGQPSQKSRGTPTGAISGTISLTGEDVTGNLSIMLSKPLATKIFRSMMGMDASAQVNEQEINDVVGELANMIAGGGKSKLQEVGVNFKIGLPSVVVGENHHIEPPKNVDTVVVSLTAETGEEGELFLELSCSGTLPQK
jgi:chemotaxis protein CheX